MHKERHRYTLQHNKPKAFTDNSLREKSLSTIGSSILSKVSGMEEVLKIIEDTFNKSTIYDLKRYIQENSHHKKWLMYSDYSIGDVSKPNDVISFTIMPYDDYPDVIKNRIFAIAPTDIKNKRAVNPEFIAYLREKRLFHINFILGSRKGLTHANGISQKEVVMTALNKTSVMLDKWCDNTPNNSEYFKKIKKKIGITKNELSKKSVNYNLFGDVVLVSLLAGYISYIFTKYNKSEIFGWFSDRDKIVDAYDILVSDQFGIYHHGLCERDSINSSITKIVFGIPEASENGKLWYDEMNRLPDHIAGTLADWDIEKNISTKAKFICMLEECIANNPYLVILRLNLKPNLYQCSRALVSKNPYLIKNEEGSLTRLMQPTKKPRG
jgi:hypothetical protein